MQGVTISDKTIIHQLNQAAAVRGMDINTYANELLAISRAVLQQKAPATPKKYRVMDFAGIAPTGRTAAEIDADIEASRGEWGEASQEIERA